MTTSTLPILNWDTAKKLDTETINVPEERLSELPERVLMFGTGAFLRGFASHIIHQANERGDFEGRIVMVQSTGSNRAQQLENQDGLYTLQEHGLKDGEAAESFSIVNSISRAVSAKEEWEEILKLAEKKEMSIVISNTTEVGISFDAKDKLDDTPPDSYPAKLTQWLYRKYKTLGEDSGKQIIMPCELINDNGEQLKSMVNRYVGEWMLENDFKQWVDQNCHFTNTLVDRIVPGRPEEAKMADLQQNAGYTDELWIEAEWYRLWAIEGDEKILKERLGFARNDETVVIAGDITPYRERKVRILNGSHTAMTPLSILDGNRTVFDTTKNKLTHAFLQKVIYDEIIPSLDINKQMAVTFADEVLERFANPYLDHRLVQIAFQATTKIGTRLIPIMRNYHKNNGNWPLGIILGIASHLRLLEHANPADGGYVLTLDGDQHLVKDVKGQKIVETWKKGMTPTETVKKIMNDEDIWGEHLEVMSQLSMQMAKKVRQLRNTGCVPELQEILKSLEVKH